MEGNPSNIKLEQAVRILQKIKSHSFTKLRYIKNDFKKSLKKDKKQKKNHKEET